MASGSADWTSWGLFGTNSADASRPYQGSQIQLNIDEIWWNPPVRILQSFLLNSGDLPEKSTSKKN
jgi:hypothetical protein